MIREKTKQRYFKVKADIDSGSSTAAACKKHGMSTSNFYASKLRIDKEDPKPVRKKKPKHKYETIPLIPEGPSNFSVTLTGTPEEIRRYMGVQQ